MKPTAKRLVKRSTKATCAIMEREVNVKPENVKHAKRVLRDKGFQIIGTSERKKPRTKLWFIRRGANL